MKKLFFIFFLLSLCLKLTAQQKEFVLKNYTQEEGLPSNETYYVFEDSKKYIWIGTDNGVVRYNGNKFEQFDLPDNVVFQIREDKKGRIWFFTHKAQLAYFENEKIHYYKYNNSLSQRINKIHIKDAKIDDSDNIVLSSSIDSSYTITAQGLILGVSNKHQNEDGNTSFNITILNKTTCFTEIKSSKVISTDSIDIFIRATNKNSFFRIACKQMHLMHFGSIITTSGDIIFFAGKYVFKFEQGEKMFMKEMPEPVLSIKNEGKHVWVGLKSGGAYRLDEHFDLIEPHPILPGKSITSFCNDYEGGLWITTLENGVYYIKNQRLKHFQFNNTSQSDIPRIVNFNDSILLFANHNGLYSLSDTAVRLIQQYQNYNVSDIVNKDKNNLYFLGGTYKITDKITQTKVPGIKNILFLNTPGEAIFLGKDTIIASTSSDIVMYRNNFENTNRVGIGESYTTRIREIFDKPGKILKGNYGIIWCGTNDGLYKIQFPYNIVQHILPSSALLKNGISCLRQLPNGFIVAGIRSKGVAIIGSNEQIIGITEKEGLLSNKVRFILANSNKIWIATTKGISVIEFTSFSPAKYTITNISKNDGLYNVIINQLIIFKNNVVAATSNGIYFIEKPDLFLAQKNRVLPFYINNIRSYQGDTCGITAITLPYSKNRLVIKYTAISFNAHDKILYSYRFNTKDTLWQNTTNTERIIENLEPGTYNFQIRASIPDQQRFSSVQSLIITIEKPWWQNNWLRVLTILSFASLIYFFVSKRIKRIQMEEKRKTELNAKLAELEQTALRSQMNPHFIFNCLTSIQQLIISGNKIDANEYLVKFSRLIRKTLDLSAQPFISIREEKEYLTEYLLLEQLRLSGRFEYTISAGNNIDTNNTFIPNMMIQPVVENCIRHGIKPMENKKGIITIQFEQQENHISCIVTDNGIGRKNTALNKEQSFTKHKSYGMDIVRKRLETFSEFETSDSSIQVNDLYNTDGTPAGTQVILQLPFKNNI